jgi:heme-degrading monooxygenase HmoA
MILEQAVFAITPGSEAAFESALEEAQELVAQTHGFRSLQLRQGLEQPASYLLLIEWETIDDHMVGFRESARYPRGRELIGPYFASAPDVHHFGDPLVTRAGGD